MSQNKTNKMQYSIPLGNGVVSGLLYIQNFKVACPSCNTIGPCAKRYIKQINIGYGWIDIDRAPLDAKWQNAVKNGLKQEKYYCCPRCLAYFKRKNPATAKHWGSPETPFMPNKFLIQSRDILAENHAVIYPTKEAAEAALKLSQQKKQPEQKKKVAMTAQEASKLAFKKKNKPVDSKEIKVVTTVNPGVAPLPKQKKKKSNQNHQNQKKKKEQKDQTPKWGQCPICHGSVKRDGRRDKNNKRFNVISNHFSGNRQCGGSELSWESVITSQHPKEKYQIVIEDITDGKL